MLFLYGPPAVGKLTVARLVAERMGFRVLHNHLTIDAVAPVLDFGTDAFWGVVGRLRRDLVSAAAEGTDLVYAAADRIVAQLGSAGRPGRPADPGVS